jgi:hypothetical protein
MTGDSNFKSQHNSNLSTIAILVSNTQQSLKKLGCVSIRMENVRMNILMVASEGVITCDKNARLMQCKFERGGWQGSRIRLIKH